ncbi:MAG: hypothetical protein ACLQRM_17410 [Acidimicrobiales bacterium]
MKVAPRASALGTVCTAKNWAVVFDPKGDRTAGSGAKLDLVPLHRTTTRALANTCFGPGRRFGAVMRRTLVAEMSIPIFCSSPWIRR